MTTPAETEPSTTQIERQVEVPEATSERLWELIATAEGWEQWLVERADVVVAPGADGTVDDEGRTLPVRVDEVRPGERVRFAWGDSDVELSLGGTVDGPVVRIVERRAAPPRSVTTAPKAWLSMSAGTRCFALAA